MDLVLTASAGHVTPSSSPSSPESRQGHCLTAGLHVRAAKMVLTCGCYR